MLRFHFKFVQTDRRTDRRTDNGKTICPPNFRYWGIKITDSEKVCVDTFQQWILLSIGPALIMWGGSHWHGKILCRALV